MVNKFIISVSCTNIRDRISFLGKSTTNLSTLNLRQKYVDKKRKYLEVVLLTYVRKLITFLIELNVSFRFRLYMFCNLSYVSISYEVSISQLNFSFILGTQKRNVNNRRSVFSSSERYLPFRNELGPFRQVIIL